MNPKEIASPDSTWHFHGLTDGSSCPVEGCDGAAQSAHDLSDSDKLDLILASMQNIEAIATQVLAQAAPVIAQVSASPILKMFGGR